MNKNTNTYTNNKFIYKLIRELDQLIHKKRIGEITKIIIIIKK